MADHDEDLKSTETDGYKKPKEATLNQMKDLDKDDEALNKWKASLLGGADASPANDPRRVVVLSLTLESPGRSDVIIELDSPGFYLILFFIF